MKPVTHYNMLADVKDIGLQPEDFLFITYINLVLDQEEDEMFENENMLIKQSYSNVQASKLFDKQSHLSATEKNKLQETLDLHPKLFDGKLRRVPNYKFKIILKPGGTLSFQGQLPIPYTYQTLFKKKLQNITNDGVMSKRTKGSQWAAPSFC